MKPALEFFCWGSLTKQLYRFLQILTRPGHVHPLTAIVPTQGKPHVTIPLTLDDSRQSLVHPTSPLTYN